MYSDRRSSWFHGGEILQGSADRGYKSDRWYYGRVSLAQLGNLADIPYGLGMSVGFAVLGMLIQFAINKPVSDEEDEETVDEESTEQIYRRNQNLRQDQSFEQSQDRDMEESIYARGQKGQARKNGKRS